MMLAGEGSSRLTWRHESVCAMGHRPSGRFFLMTPGSVVMPEALLLTLLLLLLSGPARSMKGNRERM